MNTGQHRNSYRPTHGRRIESDTSRYRPYGYRSVPDGRPAVLPWVLAVLPAISLGFAAFVPFVHLASRRCTLRWRLLAAVFAVACAGEWSLLIPRETDLVDNVGAITMMTLMVTGTTLAFVVRERQRTERKHATPAVGSGVTYPAAPDLAGTPARSFVPSSAETDTGRCAALTARLVALQTQVNADAAFPSEGRRLLDDIAGSVSQVASHGAVGGRIDGAVNALEPLITDYLPECVAAFRRLPSDTVRLPNLHDGRTAVDELTIQLGLMNDHVATVAARLGHEDLRRLEEHGAFLRDKFGRSELDLP